MSSSSSSSSESDKKKGKHKKKEKSKKKEKTKKQDKKKFEEEKIRKEEVERAIRIEAEKKRREEEERREERSTELAEIKKNDESEVEVGTGIEHDEGRPLPGRFNLKSTFGRYLGADKKGKVSVKKSVPSDTEVWTLQWFDDQTIALKSQYNEYLMAKGLNVKTHQKRSESCIWKFNKRDNVIVLSCSNGFLVSYQNGHIEVVSCENPPAEAYWIVDTGTAPVESSESSDSEGDLSKILTAELSLEKWTAMAGRLRQIDAKSEKVWGINSSGCVYHFDNNNWHQISGRLSWIAVSPSGSVWGCTKHKEVLKREDNEWVLKAGVPLVTLSMANDNDIWGLDEKGWPWRFNGLFFSQLKKEKLKAISVGSDGVCWGILKKQKIVVYWDYTNSKWVPVLPNDTSKWRSISVVNAQNIWAIDKFCRVFKFDPLTTSWMSFGGGHFMYVTASEKTAWVIDNKESLYKLAGEDQIKDHQNEAQIKHLQQIIENLRADIEKSQQFNLDIQQKFSIDMEELKKQLLITENSRRSDMEALISKDKIIQAQSNELRDKDATITSIERALREKESEESRLREEIARGNTVVQQELIVKHKEEVEKEIYFTWEVLVVTGDLRGAGTEASVDIVLHGELDRSNSYRLENSPYNFQRGREDKFKVVIPKEIGTLKKITIGHDNSGMDPSWYLERVTVIHSTGVTYKFIVARWLSIERDTLSLDLVPIEGDFDIPKIKNYKILVVTGDRLGAGTEATVTLSILGTNGNHTMVLDTPRQGYVRNTKDGFGFDSIDLGVLKQIRIGHDNTGFTPAWFLEKVIIRDDTEAKDYFFLCGKWLRDSDATLSIEIDASEVDGAASLPLVDYNVQVITGDRRGAGTDANVCITIYGEHENSGEKVLDTSADNFERGRSDNFVVRCLDLKNLTKIRIGHDNHGFGPAWFLDKVIVTKQGTDKSWYFLCGNWISADTELVREIPAQDVDGKAYLPLVPYKVTIITGNIRGAGTDANVNITIYGTNGDSGNRLLDSPENNFERGKTDIFGIEAVDLGTLTKIRIGHDNSGVGPGWFIDKVIIRNVNAGEDTYFLVGRWLAVDEGDGAIVTEIAPSGQDGVTYDPLITYTISVFTGDRRGSGTDANIHIILWGTKGDSGKQELNNHRNNFERGRTDIFSLRCIDLGDLTRISIGHDNTGAAPGWFLAKVVVKAGDGKTWVFGANRWLAHGEDDGKIQVDIAPIDGEFAVSSCCTYRVEIITGDRPGSGTNANVYITLFGENGKKSREYKLDNQQDNFEKNKTDVFSLESDDMGNLTKIRIGHDNSGLFPGWFLNKVIIWSEKLQKSFYFLHGNWLDSEHGTIAEIPASENGIACLPMVKYNIKVQTGDRRFAGTDANVFINIVGENGDTGDRILDKRGNCFERNSCDEFEISAVDLGPLKKIRIGHDGTGIGAGWFLDKVLISRSDIHQNWFFLCGKWFDKSEGDGLILREIPAQNEDGISSEPSTKYHVQVWTGDRRGAGTDANVTINVIGEKGESGDINLSKRGNCFERNKVDDFLFEAVHLGELKKIRIGHDNSGLGPGWFLDKIIVRSELNHKQWYFLCGRWLSKDEDDGAIVREIDASVEDGRTYMPLTTYEIEVITGDRRGAGTDANVRICLFGKLGDTGDLALDNKIGQFSRNSKEIFFVNCGNVGEMTKVRIGHDGTGIGSGWFLDKVIVTDRSDNKKYYFPHGKWLAVDEDDGAIIREIPSCNEDVTTYPPLSRYQVTVRTGDRRGAGTDAEVFIKLIGSNGSTGEIKLDNSQNNFEKNKVDVFSLEAVDIGHVKQIQIGHDNSGFGPGWFLDKVIVKSELLGKEFFFLCGRWLATDMDDGTIIRTIDAQDVDGIACLPLVTYKIAITTANVRGAGTDANVSITLFGDLGESGPHLLDNANNNFERGSVDVFCIECVDLGEKLTKIRIGHDGSGFGPGWILEKVVITDQRRNTVTYFISGQWFDVHEGDGAIVRDIPSSTEDGVVGIPKRDYLIKVVTGDREGSGTDARVFIVLFGENGSTPEMILDKSGNNFERKTTDEFNVNAIDLGQLKKIRIGHDGSGPGAGWFLEKVIIKPLSKGDEKEFPEMYFFCGRWLAKDEDDGQIVRELAGSTEDGQTSLPWVHYKVKVYTGDRRGAGTDANVFMVLTGTNGDSGRRALEKKGNCFERGRVDEFEFEFIDLGKITKISVGHDNSGVGPGWFLDKVIVEGGDGTVSFFLFGKWFATDEEDGLIVRETVPAAEDAITYLPEVNYVVRVFTGNRFGAGTDANVHIQIFGTHGKSDRKLLDNSQNNFERSKEDVFGVRAIHLGDLTKIIIGHDNKGIAPGWFLDKVVIFSEKENKSYYFLCGKWFATDEEDGLLEREIPASDADGNTYLPLVDYKISIITGDRFGAGTDANVKITLYGSNGDTGDRIVDPKGNSFERGQTDVIGIKAVDLGKLMKLRIGHDNSGVGPGWFLEKVIVENLSNNEITYFLCGKWLATDEEDGLIVRELPSSGVDGIACLPMKHYEIKVITGDRWGAGTDANVYIFIFGDNGDSGKHFLSNQRNNFERGKTDVFRIQCVDLGPIHRIKIGHDGTQIGAGWFLDKVIISSGDGKEWYFLAGRWLAIDEDDKKLEIDLPASEKDTSTYLPFVNYTVTVYTGDRRGAGTDANVIINIVGTSGESGEKHLENNQNNFERNKVDVFVIRSLHLGELQKIRIGHDNSGFGPGWFLDKVVIQDEKDNKQYYFLAGRWFAKDEEDGAIFRELPASQEDGKTYAPMTLYEISVVTGDRPFAGTDATVSITIFGENGNSGERKLDNPKHHPSFERGQTDQFGIESVHLGDLKKIIIGQDNKGIGASWFLDKVIILDTSTKKQYFFLCGKWLSDDEDDKQLVREIASQNEDGTACDPVVNYKVTVVTGDRRGAGTDATVSIFIEGDKSNSSNRVLDASFSRGSSHSFSLPCVDLGTIKRIRIGHDNRGIAAGWFLDKVVIRDPLHSLDLFFPAGRWLAVDEEDSQTSMDIVPSVNDVPTPQLITYRVTVHTGDRRGAGTDARVFIELFGEKSKTGERTLDGGSGAFERTGVDEFGIESLDLGVLQRIRIGHDGSGFGPGWFLDKIIVRNEASGEQWFFLCGQWLDSSQGDGKIIRDINASMEDGTTYSPFINYLVEVRTADRKGAGTHSNVFLTIYGKTTDSGEQKLEGSDSFKTAAVDHFEIQTSDLGDLTKINLRHDNSGWGSNASWFVDKVIVTNQKSGVKWYFLIGKNLCLKTGEKKISCQVPASNEDGVSVLPLTVYKITILTGDMRGAGTNANVFIQIFGQNGDSGILKLEGEDNSFEGGQRAIFGFQLVDLGDIQKIKIGHDNSGFFPGWFLVNVQIRNEKTGQEYTFPSNQWFDKDKGDAQIIRDLFPVSGSGKISTLVGFEAYIVTANKHGAGTEANVFLQVFGTSGETERMALGKGKFERGQTHKHDFQAKDLGAVTKIRIGHDNSGLGPGWLLETVTIKNLRNGDSYLFPVHQWLDKSEGDGKIVRDVEVAPGGI